MQENNLRQIRENIEQHEADGYALKNGVLYREIKDASLLVVPKSMQTQIVRRAHERGHFGITMREKVEKMVQSCIDRILEERKKGTKEGLLNDIEKGKLPLDTYHVDHIGPLPTTKKSYRYIFVVADAFTKFVWLYPTKSTGSAEIISRLEKQSVCFGNPQRIISDRGTAFTAGVFENYCNKKCIEHVWITTGIRRANGQVERVNGMLVPLLEKLSAPTPGEWFRHLEKAQRYLNATPSRSTNVTPLQLLFGTQMRTQDDPQIR